jgi:subtilisin family serine protease
VICIGLGTSQGPSMGVGVFSNFLAKLETAHDVAFIVCAGNEGISGHHYYGEINPMIGYNDMVFAINDFNLGFFMEFWGQAPNIFAFDIYAPTDEFVGHIPVVYNQQATIEYTFENTTIKVDSTIDSRTGDFFTLFRFINPNLGTWRFRVWLVGNLFANFHVWLPISNFISNTFFINATSYVTITAPGNEESILTVTAYNSYSNEFYPYASKGPTKDSQIKPDIAAPGVCILTPMINNQYAWNTGSSVAAAYTAGSLSLLFEWALNQGNLSILNNPNMQSLIKSGAKRLDYMRYPNPEWGYGFLDIENVIQLAEKQLT